MQLVAPDIRSNVARGWFASLNIQVRTPDGVMYVNILDDDKGDPIGVHITLGKNGGAGYAWAAALGEMVTLALESGIPISKIIERLSSITSDKQARILKQGMTVRSGVEGLWIALVQYRREKMQQLQRTVDLYEDYDDDEGPKFHNR